MPANTPTNDNFLEAGLLDEKRVLQTPSSNPSGQAAQQNRNMTAIRRLLVALTVSVLVTVAVARTYPVPCGLHRNGDAEAQAAQAAPNVVASQDDSTFAQLLRSASPESLHRLLHDYLPEKFQHGVFPSDKEAVEAVHGDSAALATSIVQIAKRQNNNNSTAEETSDDPTQEPTPDPTTKDPEPTTESKEPTKPPTTSNPPPTSKTPDPTPSEPTPTPTPTDNDPGTSSPDETSSPFSSTEEPSTVPTTQPPSSTSSSRSSSSSPSPTRSGT